MDVESTTSRSLDEQLVIVLHIEEGKQKKIWFEFHSENFVFRIIVDFGENSFGGSDFEWQQVRSGTSQERSYDVV